MLVQYRWLSSLLFIASATAHVYPPAGLKPRYLATGTGISLPSTGTAPYPTGTANGTAIATGSVTTSTATPTPISPTELFSLVISAPGYVYDGDPLTIESDTSGASLLVLYPTTGTGGPSSFTTFNINADGTLQNQFSGGIAAIFAADAGGTIFFDPETLVDETDDIKVICEDVAGTLTCHTGPFTVFYECPFQVITGTLVGGTIDVGQTVPAGCTEITLRIVPV